MKRKSSADKLLNYLMKKQATILNAPLAATILNTTQFCMNDVTGRPTTGKRSA